MKNRVFFLFASAIAFSGCVNRSDSRHTNPDQPGPVIGQTVGHAVGAVTGNVAGAVVGVGEGIVDESKKSFKNERRVIRTWKTETTSDGRTIQVAVETEVDEQGRPISAPETK